MTNSNSETGSESRQSLHSERVRVPRKAALAASELLRKQLKRERKVHYINDLSGEDDDYDLEQEAANDCQQRTGHSLRKRDRKLQLCSKQRNQKQHDKTQNINNVSQYLHSSNDEESNVQPVRQNSNIDQRSKNNKKNNIGEMWEMSEVFEEEISGDEIDLQLPQKRQRAIPRKHSKKVKKNYISELCEISGDFEDEDVLEGEVSSTPKKRCKADDQDEKIHLKQNDCSTMAWQQIKEHTSSACVKPETIEDKEKDIFEQYKHLLIQLQSDQENDQSKGQLEDEDEQGSDIEIQQEIHLPFLQYLNEILEDNLEKEDEQREQDGDIHMANYAEKDDEDIQYGENEDNDEVQFVGTEDDGTYAQGKDIDAEGRSDVDSQQNNEEQERKGDVDPTQSFEAPKESGYQLKVRRPYKAVQFSLQQSEMRVELNQICGIPGILKDKTQRQVFLGENWPAGVFLSQRQVMDKKVKYLKQVLRNQKELQKYIQNPPSFIRKELANKKKQQPGSRLTQKRQKRLKKAITEDKNAVVCRWSTQQLERFGDALSKMGVVFESKGDGDGDQQIDVKALENKIKQKRGGEMFCKKFRSLLNNKHFMQKVKQQQLLKIKAMMEKRKEQHKQAYKQHEKKIAEYNISNYRVVIKKNSSLRSIARNLRKAKLLGVQPQWEDDFDQSFNRNLLSKKAIRWAKEQFIDVEEMKKVLKRDYVQKKFQGEELFPQPWMCVNVIVDVKFLIHKCAKCGIQRLKLAQQLLNENSPLHKQLNAICEGHGDRREEINTHIQRTLRYSQHELNLFDPEKVVGDAEDILYDKVTDEAKLNMEIDRIQQQKVMKIRMEDVVSKLKTCLSRLWGNPHYCPVYSPPQIEELEVSSEEQGYESQQEEEQEQDQAQGENEDQIEGNETEAGQMEAEEEEEEDYGRQEVQPSQSQYEDEFAVPEDLELQDDGLIQQYKKKYHKWVDYPEADPDWRDPDTDLFEHSRPEQLTPTPTPAAKLPSKKPPDEEEWCRRWEEVHRCAAEQAAYLAFCLNNQLLARGSVYYFVHEKADKKFPVDKAIWQGGEFVKFQCPVCDKQAYKKHRCKEGKKIGFANRKPGFQTSVSPPDIHGGSMNTVEVRQGERIIRPKAFKTPLSSYTRNIIVNRENFFKKNYCPSWNQNCTKDVGYSDILVDGVEKWWRDPIQFQQLDDQNGWDENGGEDDQFNKVEYGFIPYKLYLQTQQALEGDTEISQEEGGEQEGQQDSQDSPQTIDTTDGDLGHMHVTDSQQEHDSFQGSETEGSLDRQQEQQQQVEGEQVDALFCDDEEEEDGEDQQERQLTQLIDSMPRNVQAVMFAATNIGLRTDRLIHCAERIKAILGQQ